jgi:hypothetical protein
MVLAGGEDLDGIEKAHAITCATAQLGGILWSFVIAWIMLFACILAPVGGACALVCWRLSTQQGALRKARAEAMDKLYVEVERMKTARARPQPAATETARLVDSPVTFRSD